MIDALVSRRGRRPRIRSQMLPHFVAAGRAAGIDIDRTLERFSLPPDLDRQTEVEVPLGVLRELLEAIAEAVGDPCLGLEIARSLPRGGYGLLEFTARTSATLGEACHCFCRY